MPGLPRTNNDLESHFRDTRRRLLRTTGQQGLTQRTLQRQGAWELLPRPPTEAQVLGALCQTSPEDLAQERQRFAAHRQRFRLQRRSRKQTRAQFEQLRQRVVITPSDRHRVTLEPLHLRHSYKYRSLDDYLIAKQAW